MFIRIQFLTVLPDHMDALKKLYNDEIIPSLRDLKGYENARLLEPLDTGESFMVLMEWESQTDAEAYESSGLYKEQHNKVISFTTSEPTLKKYKYATLEKMSTVMINEEL